MRQGPPSAGLELQSETDALIVEQGNLYVIRETGKVFRACSDVLDDDYGGELDPEGAGNNPAAANRLHLWAIERTAGLQANWNIHPLGAADPDRENWICEQPPNLERLAGVVTRISAVLHLAPRKR